ncbi:PREDICTED: uncharacterized protein LOC104824369 [Tarenaya hassleriana]|uniref:uncharacterized protein LOC104824369 n=1 Tax=Tarenaya hassleriana TaxID=28532 RepID=UPI00053C4148|nr:PREDICTED: uncharacterized protein LOC104824369 [Tarenaya hassleriana]
MVKPLSFRVVQGLVRLHCGRVNPVTVCRSKPSSSAYPSFSPAVPSNGVSQFQSLFSFRTLSSKPTSTNVGLSQILSCPKLAARVQHCGASLVKPGVNVKSSSALRLFSSKSSGTGRNIGGDFARKVVDKPVNAVTSTFARYREAIGLHVDAFWKKNYLFLFGGGAVVVSIFLWRIMFGIANTFVGLSEGMAKYGFLALSSAIVAFSGLYIRSRFTINPDKVYRMTMRKLNTAAGILEVMGAPLSGSDLRAYVMSGGGITFKNFKPTIRSKRCFLIFPIRGSERKGLVSVGVRKKKGQYDMKLLAVDIPMASGPDQRLFLVGDEEEYRVGGGLISELRDPVVKAMAATKEFDNLDQIEEEEDAERELQEAERKHRQELEELEKDAS